MEGSSMANVRCIQLKESSAADMSQRKIVRLISAALLGWLLPVTEVCPV
jgi:hypothetical protein